MSAQINANVLKNFIIRTTGLNKFTANELKKYNVDSDKFSEINKDENNYADLNEVLQDDNLYEQFATLFVEESEKKADTKDAEKEKEEQTKVKDKNGAGV